MYGKIFKNTTYLFTAQALIKGVSFLYTIFLARSLDVENFGIYTVALSYFALVSAIADLGITRFFIREGSKERANLDHLLASVTLLRLAIVAVSFAVLSVIFSLFDPEKTRVSAILVIFLALFPQAVALTFECVFVSMQKFSVTAIGQLVLNVVTVLVGITLINLNYDLFGVITAFIVGQIIYALYMFSGITHLKMHLYNSVTTKKIKEILKSSLPYGILSVIGIISFRADSIILSYTRGNFETGIYGAAFRFLDAVSFFPAIVATVLFPVVAEMFESNFSGIKKVTSKSIKVMIPLGFLVTLSFVFILPILIRAFLPKYVLAIDSIKVLGLAVPFIFAHMPLGQIILSTDKYLKQSLFMFIGIMLFNIILSLIFIPKYGFIAASWITVFGELLTFSVFWSFLHFKVRKI